MTQTGTIADLFAGQAPAPGPFEGSDSYTIAITLWRWNKYYNIIVEKWGGKICVIIIVCWRKIILKKARALRAHY